MSKVVYETEWARYRLEERRISGCRFQKGASITASKGPGSLQTCVLTRTRTCATV